jgi:hypothetical protein
MAPDIEAVRTIVVGAIMHLKNADNSPIDDGDRPAIEITEEMIEAGAEAAYLKLDGYCGDTRASMVFARRLACDVLEAALASQRAP